MANLSRPSAHALLQGIVLLWGCTAILGHQISIQAVPLVWYRLVIVVAVLAVFVPLRGHSLRVPRAAAVRYAGVGAIVGIHWLCFYGAIKVAGIATAVLTLSTMAFFTAFIEPIAFRRRIDRGELAIGALVVVGVALLVQIELHPTPLGLALGLGSALFASTFGVMNGKLAHHELPERLMLYEAAAAFVVVSLCFVAVPSQLVTPSRADFGWLVVLGVMCTVVPQVLVLHVLRTLSPFTVAVTTNLEPVYALILAAFLFPSDEPPGLRFYLGAAVLLGLVIANGIRKARPTSASPALETTIPPG
ncbi:MAG: DMT family transporter [Deltaproteobacteria bacterium]